jgi:hypothetical protein
MARIFNAGREFKNSAIGFALAGEPPVAQVLLIFAQETGTNNAVIVPSPTSGRGCPAGAGEGALAGKSTLSLTLSHQWEREQTQVCSHLFPGQKSVARSRYMCLSRPCGAPSPTSGRGNNYCVVRSVFAAQKSVACRATGVSPARGRGEDPCFAAHQNRHLTNAYLVRACYVANPGLPRQLIC